MLLTGTHTRSVDEKLRVAIPKRLRAIMGCADRGVLFLTPGTDGCVAVYTEEGLAGMAARLAEGSPTRQQVRDFSRMFYGQAQQVDLDAQGRVRIPGVLAEMAGLGKEVVLIGVHDHLEIWSAKRWQAYLTDKQKDYDQIAEAAFDGPPGA